MQTQELVADVQRVHLDAAFGLASTVMDSIGKLAALNAQFTRAALKDALELATKTVENPQDWVVLHGTLGAPMAEKVQAYSREVLAIMSSAQAQMLGAAREEGEARMRRVQTFFDEAIRNAPAGSEAAVAALSSAITAANTLYQTFGRAGQSAVDVVQGNFDVVADATSKSARRASAQREQAAT